MYNLLNIQTKENLKHKKVFLKGPSSREEECMIKSGRDVRIPERNA